MKDNMNNNQMKYHNIRIIVMYVICMGATWSKKKVPELVK